MKKLLAITSILLATTFSLVASLPNHLLEQVRLLETYLEKTAEKEQGFSQYLQVWLKTVTSKSNTPSSLREATLTAIVQEINEILVMIGKHKSSMIEFQTQYSQSINALSPKINTIKKNKHSLAQVAINDYNDLLADYNEMTAIIDRQLDDFTNLEKKLNEDINLISLIFNIMKNKKSDLQPSDDILNDIL